MNLEIKKNYLIKRKIMRKK